MMILSLWLRFGFVVFELCLKTNKFFLYFPLRTAIWSAFRCLNEKQTSVV